MRILVTGGAGYVGGHLVDVLLSKGHEVTVFDKLLYEDQYLKPVNFVHGDICDTDAVIKLTQDSDLVIWLAALVGDPACAINNEETFNINSKSVRDFVANYSGKLIFLSTCSVYGAQDLELDENAAVGPLSKYAESKLEAESFLVNRPETWILRLGTLFGISDYWSRVRLDLAINTLTRKAFYENKLQMFGGNQWRPFLHVKDVGNTIALNLTEFPNGIFNLASVNLTISSIVETIGKYFNNLEVEVSEVNFQDARNYRVSTVKAQNEITLPNFIGIEHGIEELISIFQSGRIPNTHLSKFINVETLKNRNV